MRKLLAATIVAVLAVGVISASSARPTVKNVVVLATDHGRGATNTDWTNHGRKVPAAEATWMAVMGPGTPALSVRESVTVSTAQVAATVAALLGEDLRRGVPAAAPPLPGIGAAPASAKGR